MEKQMADLKNFETTLSRFANEVLSKGPEAVLPQNLDLFWLKRIQKMADYYLDTGFESNDCENISAIEDPIITSCVYEICSYRNINEVDLPKNKFIKYATIYLVCITMETVRRESGIQVDLPTLENIFSDEWINQLKTKNPELGRFFKRVCLDNHTSK
jgi:hypothetical protein